MTTDYDVVIIGAGINGAGVAQVLSAEGKKVLVLEKENQAGMGTSSKSSKLVHGGLRYLEYGAFALVRESLRERAYLLRHYPHLVKRNDFYLPLYTHSSRPGWKIMLGLLFYYLLSGLHKNARFSRIPAKKWHTLNGLNKQNLKAVYRYSDAQTDDQALTQAVLQQALQQGADATFNQAIQAIGLYDSHVHITCAQQTYTAKVLVNAAGPWVAEVCALTQPAITPQPLSLVQGTHIVLNRPCNAGCFYVEAPTDQRAVFVMPWKNHTTLVGTTELVRETPEQCAPTQEEQDYLLHTYQYYFDANTSHHEICEAMAGLRVLPKVAGNASASSREVRLIQQGRMLSIYGGKLTTWRATAKKVAQSIQALLHT